MEKKFEARRVGKGPHGSWTFLPIPFDVLKAFGKKSRIPVTGQINGFPYRNSLMPEGDGTHSMMVNKELQAGANAKAGDTVRVTMAVDAPERVVEVPPELKEALGRDEKASATFASLAYTHQKEYADWIASAKRAETKSARILKALEMLGAGKKGR